jgi:hypothetical protein
MIPAVLRRHRCRQAAACSLCAEGPSNGDAQTQIRKSGTTNAVWLYLCPSAVSFLIALSSFRADRLTIAKNTPKLITITANWRPRER